VTADLGGGIGGERQAKSKTAKHQSRGSGEGDMEIG
jgi:hypothetical protein